MENTIPFPSVENICKTASIYGEIDYLNDRSRTILDSGGFSQITQMRDDGTLHSDDYLDALNSYYQGWDSFSQKANFDPRIAVLQLKDDPKYYHLNFRSFNELDNVSPEMYEVVYVERPSDNHNYENSNLICEDVYTAFNSDKPRPGDYYGHSVSVGDIIVFGEDSFSLKAYFCESFGFRELPDFVNENLKRRIQTSTNIKAEYEMLSILKENSILGSVEKERLEFFEFNYKDIFDLANLRLLMEDQDKLKAIHEYEKLSGGEKNKDNLIYFHEKLGKYLIDSPTILKYTKLDNGINTLITLVENRVSLAKEAVSLGIVHDNAGVREVTHGEEIPTVDSLNAFLKNRIAEGEMTDYEQFFELSSLPFKDEFDLALSYNMFFYNEPFVSYPDTYEHLQEEIIKDTVDLSQGKTSNMLQYCAEFLENIDSLSERELSEAKKLLNDLRGIEQRNTSLTSYTGLATAIDNFAFDNDFYEYMDTVGLYPEERQENIQRISNDLEQGKTDSYIAFFNELSGDASEESLRDSIVEQLNNITEQMKFTEFENSQVMVDYVLKTSGTVLLPSEAEILMNFMDGHAFHLGSTKESDLIAVSDNNDEIGRLSYESVNELVDRVLNLAYEMQEQYETQYEETGDEEYQDQIKSIESKLQILSGYTIRENQLESEISLEKPSDVEGLENSYKDMKLDIKLFVAECMEFHNLGKIYEDVSSIQEAFEIYNNIPSNMRSMGNGIGMQIGSVEEYDLLSGGTVTDISYAPDHIKNNPQVISLQRELGNILSERSLIEAVRTHGEDGSKPYVAIESTDDYSDFFFHTNMMNTKGSGKEDYFRLVFLNEYGYLQPGDKIYQSVEEARTDIKNSVLNEVSYESITSVVFKVREIESVSDKRESYEKELGQAKEAMGFLGWNFRLANGETTFWFKEIPDGSVEELKIDSFNGIKDFMTQVAAQDNEKVSVNEPSFLYAAVQNKDTETRYTFSYENASNQYNVTRERLLGTGAASSFEKMSVENAIHRLAELKSQDYFEFRNVSEVSWYATTNNNTPYDEKWEVRDGFFVPIESHSVGITTFNGRSYSTVDEWTSGTEKYVLGCDNEDNNFFYARVVSNDEVWKGTYEYDYDGQPTRKDVEENYLNDISMREIDKHESEYGADGTRAFPNLNSEPNQITLHIRYNNPVVMNGFTVETDKIVFGSTESMENFVKGEVSYDFLDNSVRKRDNEILLYAEDEKGNVVWGTKEDQLENTSKYHIVKFDDIPNGSFIIQNTQNVYIEENSFYGIVSNYDEAIANPSSALADIVFFGTEEECKEAQSVFDKADEAHHDVSVYRIIDLDNSLIGHSNNYNGFRCFLDVSKAADFVRHMDGLNREVKDCDIKEYPHSDIHSSKTIEKNQFLVETEISSTGKLSPETIDFLAKQGFKYDNGSVIHIEEQKSDVPTDTERGDLVAENSQFSSSPTEKEATLKDEVMEQLSNGIKEVMDSERFKDWCVTNGKLYTNNYSFQNAMLTFIQKSEASYVMGYDAWQQYGRQVIKGSKGIHVFAPAFVKEYGPKGSLLASMKKNMNDQLKKNPSLEYGTFQLGLSKLSFNMYKNGLFDIVARGKTVAAHLTEESVRKFLDRDVIGKVPAYYNVVTVFDLADTTDKTEYVWLKNGFTKSECARDDNGDVIKNKKGYYKIINSDQRRNKFNPRLDFTIPEQDHIKMNLLLDVLKEVSTQSGVNVFEKHLDEDSTLKDGALGYYSRLTNDITLLSDLPVTKKVAVTMHEMAHSILHKDLRELEEKMSDLSGGEVKNTRSLREIQAEAVAYMVASNFGISTETSSFNYLAEWSNGRDLKELSVSLEMIYRESKSLMNKIEKELDARGFDLHLEQKDKTPLNEKDKATIKDDFKSFVLNESRNNDSILKNALEELNNVEDQKQKVIIEEQIALTKTIDGKLTKINTLADSLMNESDFSLQQDIIREMGSEKNKVGELKDQVECLNEERVSLVMEKEEVGKATLKEQFSKDPVKTLKSLKSSFEQLNSLSDNDLKFIATSKHISREYSRFLGVDNEKFISLSLAHFDRFKEVLSKNETAVEVSLCEQWSDTPIFEKGTVAHPKIANKIIGQAEKEIQKLKQEAERRGEYYPYSKCDVTIYSPNNKGGLSVLQTRVDIGDGEQKNLLDHLQQICGKGKDKQLLLENFSASVSERGKQSSLLLTPKMNDTEDHSKMLIQEVAKKDKALGLNEWKTTVDNMREDAQEQFEDHTHSRSDNIKEDL